MATHPYRIGKPRYCVAPVTDRTTGQDLGTVLYGKNSYTAHSAITGEDRTFRRRWEACWWLIGKLENN